jgi:hypothetical protein
MRYGAAGLARNTISAASSPLASARTVKGPAMPNPRNETLTKPPRAITSSSASRPWPPVSEKRTDVVSSSLGSWPRESRNETVSCVAIEPSAGMLWSEVFRSK